MRKKGQINYKVEQLIEIELQKEKKKLSVANCVKFNWRQYVKAFVGI